MNLYICHTRYHLLITLSKLNIEEKNEILLFNEVDDTTKLVKNIQTQFQNIRVQIHQISLGDNIRKIRFSRLFKKNILSKEMVHYRSFDNIYLFNDFTYIGVFFHQNKIKYHLLEDGYDYFTFFGEEKWSVKSLLNYIVKDIPKPRGTSKYCLSIEVNEQKTVLIPQTDQRYKKFIEVPRKQLFENISEERKELILRVFGVEELSGVLEKSVLILTQPLYIDRLLKKESIQYNFYKKIIDKYLSDGYAVYLKPHPRDTVDYSDIEGIKTIAKDVPMELIEMVSKVEFERLITHSSTAINFLTCGKEKEVLCDWNAKTYDEQLLKKYNINKEDL